jgi:hypothetical protein
VFNINTLPGHFRINTSIDPYIACVPSPASSPIYALRRSELRADHEMHVAPGRRRQELGLGEWCRIFGLVSTLTSHSLQATPRSAASLAAVGKIDPNPAEIES